MKRKILLVFVILALLCTLCMGTSAVVFAQEADNGVESVEVVGEEQAPAVTETEESGEVSEDLTSEEMEKIIAELLAKVNTLTGDDNFFKNKILPYIIAGLTELFLVGLFFLTPFLKNKSRAKKLEGFAQALQGEKQNLTTLLSSTDAPAIQKALTETFGKYIDNMMEKFRAEYSGYVKMFASMKTTIETEYAQIKALVEAARQAWASKPEVVALLAESPEKSTLENQIAENEKLKNYIREVKGEEAEKIISNLGV